MVQLANAYVFLDNDPVVRPMVFPYGFLDPGVIADIFLTATIRTLLHANSMSLSLRDAFIDTQIRNGNIDNILRMIEYILYIHDNSIETLDRDDAVETIN